MLNALLRKKIKVKMSTEAEHPIELDMEEIVKE